MNAKPPGFARWLIAHLVHGDWSEQMLDDLDDLHESRSNSSGPLRADVAYWRDALSICLRPTFWRGLTFSPVISMRRHVTLLRYDFLIASRNMKRRLGFAAINTLGLAAGLLCALFIGLYVRHELSYDRHHPNADRSHRLVLSFLNPERNWAPIGPPVGLAVKEAFPEVEEVVRFFPMESAAVVGPPDRRVTTQRGGFGDAAYFTIFGRELLQGDPSTALTQVGQAVITSSLANAVFGSEHVVGERLPIQGFQDLVVSGVMTDSPSNTHQPVDLLISMATFYVGSEEWLASARTWAGFHTYLLLRPGASAADLEAKLPAFVDEYFAGIAPGRPSEFGRLSLQDIRDIHLYSQREKEYIANSDIQFVRAFILIGLLVLLIAAFNFVNLSTARAGIRRLEIGVRKTFGAARGHLVRQFLSESVLYGLLAMVTALGLGVIAFPLFQDVAGIPIPVSTLASPEVLLAMAAAALGTGILAGLYPSAILSGFRPVFALRGSGGTLIKGAGMRKGLVVFQFVLCVSLLASSAIVWSQLSYVRTASLGFDSEHVLRVKLGPAGADAVTTNPQTFRDRVGSIPGVLAVSQASDVPGSRYSIEGMRVPGMDESHMMRVAWRSDHHYPQALGLELVEGRFFSESAPADTAGWIINEAAVRALGLERPTDTELVWNAYRAPIVGVVRDFNFASLHSTVEPLVIPLRPGNANNLLVRFDAAAGPDLLGSVQAVMNDLLPGEMLTYSFVGDEIAALYRKEDTLKSVIAIFALLAILVACLGLFGLAAHTAAERTREIGIRKVLGASQSSIVRMFSRAYAWQLGLAVAISIPLVLFATRPWLEAFAYRIDIGPVYFVVSALVTVLLAMGTVAFQAVRAARTNPATTLKAP